MKTKTKKTMTPPADEATPPDDEATPPDEPAAEAPPTENEVGLPEEPVLQANPSKAATFTNARTNRPLFVIPGPGLAITPTNGGGTFLYAGGTELLLAEECDVVLERLGLS